MSYSVKFTSKAKKQLKKLSKTDKAYAQSVVAFIKEVALNPRQGRGKPKQLKGRSEHDLPMFSRRIDAKNRLVYEIDDHVITITILMLAGHYSDH